MRCFISIDMPQKVQHEIKKLEKKLPEFKGNFTRYDNLHLTLKFLGDGITGEQIEEIKKRLKDIEIKDFEVRIDEIGVFTEEHIKIIWLHLAGESLLDLQKKIDNKLKDMFKKEERFMSHVTIARVNFVEDREKFLEALKKVKIKNINFVVNKFKLMKSELTSAGPEYKVVEEFSLETP
ncbi:MAG: RNA 2',3'-cyclic phosphodiesterase [Nanoarchaeota archaeon]|nr:RNA 2',3'-cyclic phosphodiesterase [Nanoarchaeota archaeon]